MIHPDLQKYANLINNGWKVTIESVTRRDDFGLGRNSYGRISWSVKKHTPGYWKNEEYIPEKKEEFESKWEGFLTAEEAIEDMLRTVPDPGKWEPKLEDTIIRAV